MDHEECKKIIKGNNDLTKNQRYIMIYKCMQYNYIHNVKIVFDNVLILLHNEKDIIKLFIFENDYYILKEIECAEESNVYKSRLVILKMINYYDEYQYMLTLYDNSFDSNNGFINLYENHYLIKLCTQDIYNSRYFFKSIDDRENILAPLNEKINNVTIGSALYQKLLKCLNTNKILLNMLDSLGIIINKFKFID